jgi:hypothetical protein
MQTLHRLPEPPGCTCQPGAARRGSRSWAILCHARSPDHRSLAKPAMIPALPAAGTPTATECSAPARVVPMGGPMRTQFNSKIKLGWGLAAALIVGCGANASSVGADGASQGACPSGEVYCAACHGGGFCSDACPGIECPASDGGTFDGASDAAIIEGGACPTSASTRCLDCSGGAFCVLGSCPAATCPPPDGGPDADGGRIPHGDASETCVPLSCEGLNCECGSCAITVCGTGTMDCGGCEGGAVCQANRCVASASDASGLPCSKLVCGPKQVCVTLSLDSGAGGCVDTP